MSLSANSSFIGFISFIAFWQGPHQVAQKSTSMTFPLNLEMMEANKSSFATSPVSLMVKPVFFLLASIVSISLLFIEVSFSR